MGSDSGDDSLFDDKTLVPGRDHGVTQTPAPSITPTDHTLVPTDVRAKAQQRLLATTKPVPTTKEFGDYELLEVIARGGMGVVYKAVQRKLNRVVALKMILAGQFADEQEIQRFYSEAESAAKLRHPNIVAIHEVGQVQGQHFFSMDYIEGQSLAGMVRERPLSPEKAATFVKRIADTMQFAHDRGVLHRDLKPSNVLVDRGDDPLITDFGLAKQVSAEGSQLTVSGAVLGTPSYMPPEQAAGDGAAIGPSSDVYSIGAILYELLTGRPPFSAATPYETIHQVLTVEPVSPRLLNPQIPVDLETVCLKCLQKEQGKRYSTAIELRDELDRFLRGEPIRARPVTSLERFARWCRRNPMLSTSIATALLSLILALVASTTGFVLTRRSQLLSEQSFRDSQQTVNDYLTLVSENTLLNQPGMQPLRKELLQRALQYYERFLQQRGNDPSVQDELASTYFRVGVITEVLDSPVQALPHYERALKMQRQLSQQRPADRSRREAMGNTLNALGTIYVKLLELPAAQGYYQQALDIRRRLAEELPENVGYQRTWGNAAMNLGVAARWAKDRETAQHFFREAQTIRERALEQHPSEVKLKRDLGKGYYNLANLANGADDLAQAADDYQKAERVFAELLSVEPNDLEVQHLLAITRRLLGDVTDPSTPDRARTWYQQALQTIEPLVRKNPDVIDFQVEHAGVLVSLGTLESEQGQIRRSLERFQQARDIRQELADRYPDIPQHRMELANVYYNMGKLHIVDQEDEKGREDLTQALKILKDLTDSYPDDPQFKALLHETRVELDKLGDANS